jgi:hypothetical protein
MMIPYSSTSPQVHLMRTSRSALSTVNGSILINGKPFKV